MFTWSTRINALFNFIGGIFVKMWELFKAALTAVKDSVVWFFNKCRSLISKKKLEPLPQPTIPVGGKR